MLWETVRRLSNFSGIPVPIFDSAKICSSSSSDTSYESESEQDVMRKTFTAIIPALSTRAFCSSEAARSEESSTAMH